MASPSDVFPRMDRAPTQEILILRRRVRFRHERSHTRPDHSPENTLSVACHLAGIEGDDSLGDIADSEIRLHSLYEEEENVVKYRG